MPDPKRRKTGAAVGDPTSAPEKSRPCTAESGFDPDFISRMHEIAATGLNPSSALELIIRLIAEVPAASKESMEQIKMLDKLLNTARGMMETKLKNEEAVELAGRLETLETRLADLFHQDSEPPASSHPSDHDFHEHQ